MLLSVEEFFKEMMTASEWSELFVNEQFTAKKHLDSIIEVLDEDEFLLLAALSKKDVKLGLLTAAEITTLKGVLKKAFEQNLSMRDITKEISLKIKLKDRLIEDRGKIILKVSKDRRAKMIARTEVTRVSNEGVLKSFGKENIELVQFETRKDSLVDPECEDLQGSVFKRSESHGIIPIHINCRCTWLPIIQEKNG